MRLNHHIMFIIFISSYFYHHISGRVSPAKPENSDPHRELSGQVTRAPRLQVDRLTGREFSMAGWVIYG